MIEGKTVRRSSIGTWNVQRKQGLFLSVFVDDINVAGYGSHVEEVDEKR